MKALLRIVFSLLIKWNGRIEDSCTGKMHALVQSR
jgi:hypothetical protein